MFFLNISYSEAENILEKGQGFVPAIKNGIFKNNKVQSDFLILKYA